MENSNTAITKATSFNEALINQFKAKNRQFKGLLGNNAAGAITSVLNVVNNSPKLKSCTPESIVACALDAASIGLHINSLNHCYLVPYGNIVKLMISYKGYITLAIKSGYVSMIHANVVYQNDKFAYKSGTIQTIDHEPLIVGDRGKIIAAYAIAILPSGHQIIELMNAQDLQKIKDKSQGKNTIWVEWESEMSKKSVIKRLCKNLPFNMPEIAQVIENEGFREDQ